MLLTAASPLRMLSRARTMQAGVGGLLVLGMLFAYCLVVTAAVRESDRLRAVALAVQRARIACEALPLARARDLCARSAVAPEVTETLVDSTFGAAVDGVGGKP